MLILMRPNVDEWVDGFWEQRNNHASNAPRTANVRPVHWCIEISPNKHQERANTTQIARDPSSISLVGGCLQ